MPCAMHCQSIRQCIQVHALKQEKLGDQCGCRLPIFKAVAPKIAQAASIEDVGIGTGFLSVLWVSQWAAMGLKSGHTGEYACPMMACMAPIQVRSAHAIELERINAHQRCAFLNLDGVESSDLKLF